MPDGNVRDTVIGRLAWPEPRPVRPAQPCHTAALATRCKPLDASHSMQATRCKQLDASNSMQATASSVTQLSHSCTVSEPMYGPRRDNEHAITVFPAPSRHQRVFVVRSQPKRCRAGRFGGVDTPRTRNCKRFFGGVSGADRNAWCCARGVHVSHRRVGAQLARCGAGRRGADCACPAGGRLPRLGQPRQPPAIATAISIGR